MQAKAEAIDTSKASPQDMLGRVLDGRYRIDSRLGSGGVGAVYNATQLALGRSVAVKLLHEGLDSSFRARFEREAKALASLKHPNIVAISDFGLSDNTPFLVMELLEGETLALRLRRGPLLPEHARDLVRELLRALGFMHEQGLVHRDLKPGNLFLELLPDGDERLKVLDFGLAKFVDSQGNGAADDTVTRAGHAVGTPAYMAPEQVGGDTADGRADVYAVGILLFEMLSGRVPFVGDPVEQLRSHLIAVPPKLAEAREGLYPCAELEALIARALAKPRDARFASANDMLNAIDALPERWLGAPEEADKDKAQASEAPTQAKPALGNGDRSTEPVAQRSAQRWSLGRISVLLAFAFVMVSGYHRFATEDVAPLDGAPAHARASAARKGASTSSAPSTPVEPETPEPPRALPPPPVTRPPARNPWTRDTSEFLRTIRKAATSGERGSERSIKALRRYNQSTATDARGHLLLARLYLNRGWLDDALTQYTFAYRVDPSSRGAPGMLSDLLKLAMRGSAATGAAQLVRDAYGDEAKPTVGSAITSFANDAEAVTRLTALQTSL